MENSETFKIAGQQVHSIMSKSQTSSQIESHQQKRRYQAIIQQEMENQRQKIKEKMLKKKNTEQKIYKNHLKEQINRKKMQLENLGIQANNKSQLLNKAGYQAQIKMKNDKIKKEQERIKREKAESMSKTRYKSAVNYQKQVRQEINSKQTQAKYTRQVHQKTEERQRQKARSNNKVAISKYLQEQKKSQQNRKYEMNIYKKQIHKHGLSKNKRDNLSCTNIVSFVVQENEEETTAHAQGQIENMRKNQIQKLKQQSLQRNRRNAVDRVNNVVQEMKRSEEYLKYCEETEKQQISYNLRRVQAGKMNQFAGVKPLTLSQMTLNKKNRAEKEFTASFLKNTKETSEVPANKYKIIEIKMKDKPHTETKLKKYTKKPINYIENESLIPQNSQGHYSFESGGKSTKSDKKIHKNKANILKETNKQQRESKDQPQENNLVSKTRMKQTRVSNNNKHNERQDLDYSESEQQYEKM